MMAKQSQTVGKTVGESRKNDSPTNSPTNSNRNDRLPLAEVVSIEADGFWLRVSDTEYFMSFASFPWFRYASDEDIRVVRAYQCASDDPDGEFMVEWGMLDVHLGTKHIEWHEENPIKVPHSVSHPSYKGKLSDREGVLSEGRYKVKASFTFECTFTVAADNADIAREMVEKLCRATCGGAKIDVHIPFDEIAWEFDKFHTNAIVSEVTEVKQREAIESNF